MSNARPIIFIKSTPDSISRTHVFLFLIGWTIKNPPSKAGYMESPPNQGGHGMTDLRNLLVRIASAICLTVIC